MGSAQALQDMNSVPTEYQNLHKVSCLVRHAIEIVTAVLRSLRRWVFMEAAPTMLASAEVGQGFIVWSKAQQSCSCQNAPGDVRHYLLQLSCPPLSPLVS